MGMRRKGKGNDEQDAGQLWGGLGTEQGSTYNITYGTMDLGHGEAD